MEPIYRLVDKNAGERELYMWLFLSVCVCEREIFIRVRSEFF